MNINYIINKVLTTSPQIFLRKVYSLLKRKLNHVVKKRKDFIISTYIKNYKYKQISNYLNIKEINDLSFNKNIEFIATMYMKHKFDLLGTGWVDNGYDSKAFGMESYFYTKNVEFNISNIINSANINNSKKIYGFVNKDYLPIDWQKDFKSGFRWSQKDWYLNQRNSLLGVDIKVPWEIGRLQHLPQLAIFAKICDNKYSYIQEFKNQVLDFIALNPPRFGVQWTCTMDVGIRSANMLLSYDIFCQLDDKNILDYNFKNIFLKSVYEHGIHIINNLEYGESLTSNHYLSNIVGLLFISSYLERTNEITKWLAFSIQEIVSEMKKQFYEDGGNFEASTSYHRLSTELMVYSTSLILGLDKDKVNALKDYSISEWKVKPDLKDLEYQDYKIENDKIILPDWYIKRLFRSGMFTYNITKQNGEIVQFGDNDSGRLFRLSPNGDLITTNEAKKKYKNLENYKSDEKLFWDENILNHKTLLSAMGGLFESELFQTEFTLEKEIISSLSKNRKLNCDNDNLELIKDHNNDFNDLEYAYASEKIFKIDDSITESIFEGLQFIYYKESGVYLFKSNRICLIVSAGSNGQKGNGGHAHNDKLSFELSIDGKDIVVDPGTYIYTPIYDKRNIFRSTQVHNTLIIDGEEQNEWFNGRYGLFSMKNQSRSYLLDFGDNFLDVGLEYRGIKQRRKYIIEENTIVIKNYSNRAYRENYNDFKLYSNGYGKLVNR